MEFFKKINGKNIFKGEKGVDDFMFKYEDGGYIPWPTKKEQEELDKIESPPMPSVEIIERVLGHALTPEKREYVEGQIKLNHTPYIQKK